MDAQFLTRGHGYLLGMGLGSVSVPRFGSFTEPNWPRVVRSEHRTEHRPDIDPVLPQKKCLFLTCRKKKRSFRRKKRCSRGTKKVISSKKKMSFRLPQKKMSFRRSRYRSVGSVVLKPRSKKFGLWFGPGDRDPCLQISE